ncbi:ATP-dependent endonuclease [Sesbania bispinosa]|nr:ATP-dependent endonuclease [Sesbania bispinosa]
MKHINYKSLPNRPVKEREKRGKIRAQVRISDDSPSRHPPLHLPHAQLLSYSSSFRGVAQLSPSDFMFLSLLWRNFARNRSRGECK